MTSNQNISAMKNGTVQPTTARTTTSSGVKRVSDKETIALQISQLGDYTAINYLCIGWPESFLAVVELNPTYPDKGKKYIVSFDDLIDGEAAGNKLYVAQSNKPRQIARWLLGRKATLYKRQP